MNRATTPVVVITGASSGIGRETARVYAKKGARLVLASRSKDALETVAEECRALGAMVLVVPTDVSHEGQLRALAAATHSEYGPARADRGCLARCCGVFCDISISLLRWVASADHQRRGLARALTTRHRSRHVRRATVCVGNGGGATSVVS